MSLPQIHPARLAACFKSPPPEAVLAGALRDPRFSDRLSRLATEVHALEDADIAALSPEDRALVALTPEARSAVATRAGIVVHGLSFVQEIRGAVVQLLEERFGESAFHDARAHRELALERVEHPDVEALAHAVARDAEACLAAWIAALPQPMRRRVELSYRDDMSLPSCHRPELAQRGADILRRLVSVEAQS